MDIEQGNKNIENIKSNAPNKNQIPIMDFTGPGNCKAFLNELNNFLKQQITQAQLDDYNLFVGENAQESQLIIEQEFENSKVYIFIRQIPNKFGIRYDSRKLNKVITMKYNATRYFGLVYIQDISLLNPDNNNISLDQTQPLQQQEEQANNNKNSVNSLINQLINTHSQQKIQPIFNHNDNEVKQKINIQLNNYNILDDSLYGVDNKKILEWMSEFIDLSLIQCKGPKTQDQLTNLISMYKTHEVSTQNIGFHFNPNGEQAIMFNMFCEQSIISKVTKGRKDFKSFYYDASTTSILLQIGQKISFKDLDAKVQQYNSNAMPLSTYLSCKFEVSQKIMQKFGCYVKNNIRQVSSFPGRLRSDLIECFACLDNQLQYNDQYGYQLCYAYYTQSDDPCLLEGLIVGPQDTPYEGLTYTLSIQIPLNFPESPPKVIFNQQILHPNISDQGQICLDILQDKWNPVLTLHDVLTSVVSILFEKNLDDVYNYYAKQLYNENPLELKKQIKQIAILTDIQKVYIDYSLMHENLKHTHNNKNNDDDDEFQYEGVDYDDSCQIEDDNNYDHDVIDEE